MSRAHPLRVADYLQHILEAIGNIHEYTAGMDLAAFLADRKTCDAVIRNLEVIGEACNNVVKNHPDFARSMLRCRGALLMKCAMHWPTAISLWTWASSGKPCRTICQRSGRK
jgi:hypothetical protein